MASVVQGLLHCCASGLQIPAILIQNMDRDMRKRVSKHIRTAKAQISLRICAVWSGLSLSANRIIGYYRMYEWRVKTRMTLRKHRMIWTRILRISEGTLFAWSGPYKVALVWIYLMAFKLRIVRRVPSWCQHAYAISVLFPYHFTKYNRGNAEELFNMPLYIDLCSANGILHKASRTGIPRKLA